MKLHYRRVRDKILGRGPRTQPGQFRAERARLVQFAVFGLLGIILVRAVFLHLFPAKGVALHQIADNQYQREIELAPYRGAMYDRRGDPLAISVKRPSIAVNPRVFDPSSRDLARLQRILKLSPQKLRNLAKKKSYFAWLARQLDPHVAEEAMNLELAGMVQIAEPARYYPGANAASHLLGFTGLDNNGLAGLERQFDKDLKGQAIHVIAEKDAKGKVIYKETSGAAPERTGNSIYLTLDRVIQEITEDELQAGVKAASAKRGFAIVSDPHTGRILAVANFPSFDSNQSRTLKISETRNSALLDTFEPGSVMKPFIIAHAIDKKSTSPSESHACDSGSLRVGKHTIHDTHSSASLTTTETVVQSSNICAYKIAQKLGREGTYTALKNFGFANRDTLLGFPGESSGRIADWQRWIPIRFANVAFGHGFVITGLELVQAMGAIANGGRLMKPTLIERVVSYDGLVVTSTPTQMLGHPVTPATARTMRGILRQVVTDKHGTGKRAATELYTTAGKTGTAQKVDPGIKGYAKDKYMASFVGFTPVADPHLVIYVMIDEPGIKPYHGGTWAAPVFSKITERSLKYLNVAPDLEPKTKSAPPHVAVGEQHGTPAAKM